MTGNAQCLATIGETDNEDMTRMTLKFGGVQGRHS
jgi:hypothetical protein